MPSWAVEQDAPQTYLICDGFNAQISMEVRHIVKLYANTAAFDDENYFLTTEETQYRLVGPLPKNPTTTDLLNSPLQITINRLDGSYIQFKNRNRNDQLDWSRPNDNGCVAAKQKF